MDDNSEPRQRPVGATVGAIPQNTKPSTLYLRSASNMYRFKDVGAVFALANTTSARLTAIFTDDDGKQFEVPVTFPGGNWLLVAVDDITGLDSQGFAKIDNPF